jgi:prepilin-type N-terminal cleavage/methylation domain-containing protein
MNTHKTHMPIPPGRLRHGFTLVELLVTITIIVVLAALVFAVTGRVRNSAQQVNSINSLRQVGIAQVAYAAENFGAINAVRDPGEAPYEGGGKGWVSNSFWGRMQPYLFTGIQSKDQKTISREIKSGLNGLFATSDVSSMTGTPFNGVKAYGDGSGLSIPLGFNNAIRAPWGQASRLISSIGDPSRILYCTYGRYFIDHTHGSSYTPLPLPGTGGRTIYYLPSRKAIGCFLDGHIEMLSPPIPERIFSQPAS